MLSDPPKKIILKCQLPDFDMKSFNVNWFRLRSCSNYLKNITSTFKQVVPPLIDLVGVEQVHP
ncbi:MAG TPA: hypothetical protein DCS30_01330 [Rhizobiales bacterium]|nr:hypothetical protein [Hyphomicrobiales bacterium]